MQQYLRIPATNTIQSPTNRPMLIIVYSLVAMVNKFNIVYVCYLWVHAPKNALLYN